ncbi:MAG: TonB-dependent receptor [Pedobacter sp.]|nr:TonB-dependent receptor [Chitinophagaceae bacterium]
MKKWLLASVLLFALANTQAQHTFKAIVKDKTTQQILVGVTVEEGTNKSVNKTAAINIANLSAGKHQFIVSFVGYEPVTFEATLPDTTTHEILLSTVEKVLEEVTVASSTRSNQNIENSPLKVEVLGKEEMAEENTIKPGNIASILGDVSGIQIQQSSAVSGNANVRIQGLDGRYTQILRDGMPLFDGFSGGFGILQIPPLDLKQIELIKGSASTLYGGGAIGGLINLISKRPSYSQEGIITLNQTTLKESNFNTYIGKRNKSIGYNFFGGVTHQVAVDVDGDGLSDVPKTDAIIVHPKIFFYPSSKTTIALGYTGTFETRNGGDMQVINGNKGGIHQFFEKNITNRNTGDILVEQFLGNGKKLEFKSSLSSFTRTINTTTHSFKGNQLNYFSEVSLFIPKDKNSWVMGINATGDKFKKLPSDPILLSDFDNNTVGAFAQFTGKILEKTTLEAGLRADHHFQYGDFVLPRVAILHRFNEHWATRLGIGLGYKTPNALTPQNVDYDIETIQSLANGLSAEKSVGYNAEVNYKKNFDEHNSLFINQAFFLTQINNPLIASVQSNNTVAFANAGSNITSQGFDTYVKLQLDELELYAGYTFTIANRNYLSQNKFVPLTPKNRFAFVIVEEIENVWRFGLEGSYTGPQYRDGDSKTPSYMFIAALVERKFGKSFSVVLNCENLLDYRQSKHETLYTGSITNPIFKPLWAPIDGRVLNLSVKWNWAKKN